MKNHNVKIGVLFLAFAIYALYYISLGIYFHISHPHSEFPFDYSFYSMQLFFIALDAIAGISLLKNHKFQKWVCIPAAILKLKFLPLGILLATYYFWYLNSQLIADQVKYNFLQYLFRSPAFRITSSLLFRISYLVSVIAFFSMHGIAMGFDSGASPLMLLIALLYGLSCVLIISIAFIPANKLLNAHLFWYVAIIPIAIFYHKEFPLFLRLLEYGRKFVPV